MARYELLSPHYLEVGPKRVPRLCEAGEIVDTADLPRWFKPTPMMQPLDDEAAEAHRAVCCEIREANAHEPGAVPVIGPMHRHPGGDHHGKE